MVIGRATHIGSPDPEFDVADVDLFRAVSLAGNDSMTISTAPSFLRFPPEHLPNAVCKYNERMFHGADGDGMKLEPLDAGCDTSLTVGQILTALHGAVLGAL